MPYFDFSIYGVDWALLFLRIAVAATFLTHGFMKKGMWKMAPSDQMPASQLYLMRLLSIVEPLAGLGILLGAFTVISSAALAIIMFGALYFKIFAWKKKFAGDGGWEFDLVLLAASILLASGGPGVFSLALQ